MTTRSTASCRTGIEALLALPIVAAEQPSSWQSARRREPSTPVESRTDSGSLSEGEQRYLRAVVQAPGCASSAYARLAHLSPSRAAAIRAELVTKGYLREHRVATSRRGRCAIVLEPLQPARRAVQESER
jgi:DNA-binding MarR family transcriptional regulator